jgi:hypothetical protein
MIAFVDTGGVRLNSFSATWPLAKLTVKSDAIDLVCLGRDYHFPRSTIQRLSKHRGLFSIGLRIEHSNVTLPAFVVFWASIFWWSRGFRKLKAQLEAFGYDVVA